MKNALHFYIKASPDHRILTAVKKGDENGELTFDGRFCRSPVMRSYCIALLLAKIRMHDPIHPLSKTQLENTTIASTQQKKRDWINTFFNCFGHRTLNKTCPTDNNYPEWYKKLSEYLGGSNKATLLWHSAKNAPSLSIVFGEHFKNYNIHIWNATTKTELDTTNKLYALAQELSPDANLATFIECPSPVSDIPFESDPFPAHAALLPRLPFGFVNRDAELKEVLSALDPADERWGAIVCGDEGDEGGLGKTSLAVRAAQDPKNAYENIYVSAQLEVLHPLAIVPMCDAISNYQELLTNVAKQLGIFNKEFPEKSSNDQADHILQELRCGRKVLLICDNIETLSIQDRSYLSSFLSKLPKYCKALAASRVMFDTGAHCVRIQPLKDASTLELIKKIGENANNPSIQNVSEDEARRLNIIAKGNPLFIHWIVGQVCLEQCNTLEEAIILFEKAPPENDAWRFAFKTLLANLDSVSEKFLAAISVFSSPVEIAVIAQVSGLKTEAATMAYETLSRIPFINCVGDHKFIVVAKAGRYIRESKSKSHINFIRNSEKRLVNYVSGLIDDNGHTNNAQFPVLENAWEHIVCAFSLPRRWTNGQLQKATHAIRDFMNYSGRWDKWLSLAKHAEQVAAKSGDYHNAGWRAFEQGFYYRLKRGPKQIIECATRAKQHWDKTEIPINEQIQVERLLGFANRQLNRFPKAIAHLERAYDLACMLPKTQHESIKPEDDSKHLWLEQKSMVLNDLAGAERGYGEWLINHSEVSKGAELYKIARPHYVEAIEIARSINNDETLSYCIGNLAKWEFDCENWELALEFGKAAKDLAEKIKRRELIAYTSVIVGRALCGLGNSVSGIICVEQGTQIYSELNDRNLDWAKDVLGICRSLSGVALTT